MYHVQNVEQRYKSRKQREKGTFTYVKIIQNLVIIFHGTNQKKEKSGIQKKQTQKKKKPQKKQEKKLLKKQPKVNFGCFRIVVFQRSISYYSKHVRYDCNFLLLLLKLHIYINLDYILLYE